MKASHWVLIAAVSGAGAWLLANLGEVSTDVSVSPRSFSTEPAAGNVQGTAVPADLVQRMMRESSIASPNGDPFAPKAWNAAPAAPPPPRASAPAVPVVPAFPYRYAGRVDVGRQLKDFYLVRPGGDLIPVTAGTVIDGVWRIDRLTPEHVEVTYLPLRQSQALSLASLTGQAAGGRPSGSAGAASSAMEAQAAPGMEESALGTTRSEEASVARRGSDGSGSGGLAAPLGLPAAASLARLGEDAPAEGSMPTGAGMSRGATPGGSFPVGPTPTGRLGESTPTGKPGPQ